MTTLWCNILKIIVLIYLPDVKRNTELKANSLKFGYISLFNAVSQLFLFTSIRTDVFCDIKIS